MARELVHWLLGANCPGRAFECERAANAEAVRVLTVGWGLARRLPPRVAGFRARGVVPGGRGARADVRVAPAFVPGALAVHRRLRPPRGLGLRGRDRGAPQPAG